MTAREALATAWMRAEWNDPEMTAEAAIGVGNVLEQTDAILAQLSRLGFAVLPAIPMPREG